jgi:hypothetical protein
MIIIKRFIDRVSASEGKTGTNVILPIEEARMLRDELAKLLSDNYDLLNNKKESIDNTVIQVEVNGGKWS